MPYIIISLYSIIRDRKGNSVSSFLFFILLCSSLGAYLVGRQPDMFDIDVFIYTIYSAILLFVLFNSFSSYKNVRLITTDGIDSRRLEIVERAIVVISIIIVFLYIYILYHSLMLLALQTVTVNEFKNDEDGATELFDSLFPHIVTTFLNFASPISFFCIAFHFYHLIRKEFKRTVVLFVLSLAYPLSGLIALSRSSTIQYLLLYFSLYFFLYPLIEKKVKKAFNKIIVLFLSMIVAVFGFISTSRFSEFYTKESKQESIINEQKSPLLFSLVDYFSQWEEYGPEAMKIYKPEYKSYGLYNSSGLALQIKRRITNKDEVTLMSEKIERIMGRLWMMFHGLIARLVYDFGYLGTILFIFIYTTIIRAYRPKKGKLNLKSLLVLTTFLPVSLMFFQGNYLGGTASNLAIIYLFIIIRIVSNKKTRSNLLSTQQAHNSTNNA